MIKKKNDKRHKILILYITAILVISLVTGVLYAKYITTINASGVIPIGRWNFSVNGRYDDYIGEIDLGRKRYTAETLAGGILAPGTEGKFDINIDASDSDIGLEYNVKFVNIQNKPTNLYFNVDDTEYYDFDSLSTALSGIMYANDVNKTRNITVNWAWDYETDRNGTVEYNDALDTREGEAAQTFLFDIEVTAKQLEPIIAEG